MGSIFSRPDKLVKGEVIGKGDYGEVLEGTLGKRPVAIKRFHRVLSDYARSNNKSYDETLLNFKRECDLLEKAKSPHIVEFLAVYEEKRTILLVMELMYQTLHKYLETHKGSLPLEKQLDICYQVSCGLLFLHQYSPQILHRDVTTKNILLNKDGSVAKLSDLGQAKFRPSSIQYLNTQTPGCLAYMPPECLSDPPRFSDKGDAFSFGVVMLEVSTQEPPSFRLGEDIRSCRAQDLAKLSDDHPLKALIVCCMDDDRHKRPDMREVNFTLYTMKGRRLSGQLKLKSSMVKQEDKLHEGKEIGRGSYGQVVEGTLGTRPVAIKKVHRIFHGYNQSNQFDNLLKSFKNECKLLEKAKSPHIVEFLGVFNKGDTILLVMELMYQTLQKYLETCKGLLPLEKQLDICYQVSCGLLFLHQRNPQILHRDVTTKNILLNEDGSVVKLSDLGQAKIRPSSIQYLTTQTPGCLAYMPPECLSDPPRFSDKGDTFSFGVVMLEVSTQEPPSLELNDGIRICRARDLAKLSDDHPLKPLIVCCTDDDRHKRPDMREVHSTIHNLKGLHKRGCLHGHLKLKSELAKQDDRIFKSDLLMHGNTTLHSLKLPSLPIPTYCGTATRIGNMLYVSGGVCYLGMAKLVVQAYDIIAATWSTLPHAPVFYSESMVICGLFTLIGGRDALTNKVTSEVWSWHEDKREWRKTIPPMPTKRVRPGIVQSGNVVALLGGLADDLKTVLDTVDILNTATLQWTRSISLKLPIPMRSVKTATCDGYVFIRSSRNIREHAIKRVFKIPLNNLEQQIQDNPARCEWTEVEETPFYHSGVLPTSHHLLVMGGHDRSLHSSPIISVFDSTANKWSDVGHHSVTCCVPCLLSVSCSAFIVIGGCANPKHPDQSSLNTFELYYF